MDASKEAVATAVAAMISMVERIVMLVKMCFGLA